MLNEYLAGLEAEETEKTASQNLYGAASTPELAKMAGIDLGERVCTNCSGAMNKLASIWKCDCGMMKRAEVDPGWADMDFLKSKGINPSMLGLGGATFSDEAAGKYLPKQASVKLLELVELNGYDLDKTASALEAQGMSKEAIWGALGSLGKGISAGAKALGKGQVGRAGKAVAAGAKGTGRQLKSTYQAAAKGNLGKGVSGPIQAGQTRGTGVLGGLKAVAKKNPALTAGAAGTGLAAAGYGLGKQSSVNDILRVADRAGRLMAKNAMDGQPTMGSAPLPLDEIRESIQEAQSREDIPGRARRWQVGGGVGGGLAGGAAGYGAGRMLGGGKAGLLGAGLGAAGGAFGGQSLGKEHGAEEARADKAVAMLRALRAHQQGAMSGYGAGMQRGYSMGGSQKMAAARIVSRLKA